MLRTSSGRSFLLWIFGGIRRSFVLPSMASGRLDTPHFRALLNPDLVKLEKLFASEGYSLRLVGGVVRDLLLGNSPKDVDLATECTPEEMIRLFERESIRYIPTGLQHGTITANINKTNYEITTLRIDHATDGRHALVQYTTDWMTDAQRRDLTINAMSLSFNGDLYDYFQGQSHLEERKIRFVGEARDRIKEDYLRILRYFRFYGRISPGPDRHDPDTLDAIRETAGGLKGISVERVWMEMSKILIGNHAPHIIHLLYQLNISQHIGLPADGNVDELKEVWERMHSHYSLEPVSLLVAMVTSPSAADELARNWKLSNVERKLGNYVTEERERCYGGETLKYYQDQLVDGIPLAHVIEVLRYCGRTQEANQLDQWTIPEFPLNGKHLLGAGMKNGPGLGRALRSAKEKWKESYYTLGKDELLQTALKFNNQ
jgi:tRNA nucleotidyltransferase (CCA-adding enzyme)